ncbi:hypothetical protein [Fictibacillus barbaricus]|uniref:Uncharacterized protein n=1 Tax=Fictibacillus barbaricus TaxID=182136 RepID=A0ABU1U224_9BACL|nr:hypothetical protein [Fictibacillus barbaricus]MDR7073540.1 hypothetical protein [Fictibacillus barbaricus]
MKYQQKEFSEDLLEKIRNTEAALKDHIDRLLLKYKPVFAKKNLDFDAGFYKEGNDPFMTEYRSSISIGISEDNEELIDLHTINIWECNRYFLGMPTSKKIPGSKIIGELLDETIEDVKEELKEYINDFLEE